MLTVSPLLSLWIDLVWLEWLPRVQDCWNSFISCGCKGWLKSFTAFSLLFPVSQVSNAGKERGTKEWRMGPVNKYFLVNDMKHNSTVLPYGSHSNTIKSTVSVLLLIDDRVQGAQTDSFTQYLLLVNNNWCYHNKNKFSNSPLCVQPGNKRASGRNEFEEAVQLNMYGFFLNAFVIQKMHVSSTRLMLMFGSTMAHFAFCNKWL